MKIVIILVLILGILGAKDFYNKTTDVKKIAWMDRGKEEIKKRLKNPHSAKFNDVYFNISSINTPTACGYVNSKNSFGGYTGNKKFIFAGTGFTFIETDVKDFNNLWNKLCN